MSEANRLLEIDRYIEQLCVTQPPAFLAALRDATAAGLPEINVSPNEGKQLYLLRSNTSCTSSGPAA